MHAAPFDRLTRFLAGAASRRRILRGVAGSVLGALGARDLLDAGAAGRRSGKRDRRRWGGRPTCAKGLRGGTLATFDVDGERFRVWVTNPETIEQIFALQAGTSQASIPSGRLRQGPGRGGHNAPWHWHLDPQEIGMAEVTIELCDGRPSYVEAHRHEFIDQVGSYCPWAARLVAVLDCR